MISRAGWCGQIDEEAGVSENLPHLSDPQPDQDPDTGPDPGSHFQPHWRCGCWPEVRDVHPEVEDAGEGTHQLLLLNLQSAAGPDSSGHTDGHHQLPQQPRPRASRQRPQHGSSAGETTSHTDSPAELSSSDPSCYSKLSQRLRAWQDWTLLVHI